MSESKITKQTSLKLSTATVLSLFLIQNESMAVHGIEETEKKSIESVQREAQFITENSHLREEGHVLEEINLSLKKSVEEAKKQLKLAEQQAKEATKAATDAVTEEFLKRGDISFVLKPLPLGDFQELHKRSVQAEKEQMLAGKRSSKPTIEDINSIPRQISTLIDVFLFEFMQEQTKKFTLKYPPADEKYKKFTKTNKLEEFFFHQLELSFGTYPFNKSDHRDADGNIHTLAGDLVLRDALSSLRLDDLVDKIHWQCFGDAKNVPVAYRIPVAPNANAPEESLLDWATANKFTAADVLEDDATLEPKKTFIARHLLPKLGYVDEIDLTH